MGLSSLLGLVGAESVLVRLRVITDEGLDSVKLLLKLEI